MYSTVGARHCVARSVSGSRDLLLFTTDSSTTPSCPLRHTICAYMVVTLADPRGGAVGPCPPLATWAMGKRPECTKSRYFQTQNRKHFLGSRQCPTPRPQLVFLCINHNVVSNMLVLSPRAITACKSRRSTANIKILSANSKHRR